MKIEPTRSGEREREKEREKREKREKMEKREKREKREREREKRERQRCSQLRHKRPGTHQTAKEAPPATTQASATYAAPKWLAALTAVVT